MKKYALLIAALATVAAVGACNKEQQPATAEPTAAAPAAPAAEAAQPAAAPADSAAPAAAPAPAAEDKK